MLGAAQPLRRASRVMDAVVAACQQGDCAQGGSVQGAAQGAGRNTAAAPQGVQRGAEAARGAEQRGAQLSTGFFGGGSLLAALAAAGAAEGGGRPSSGRGFIDDSNDDSESGSPADASAPRVARSPQRAVLQSSASPHSAAGSLHACASDAMEEDAAQDNTAAAASPDRPYEFGRQGRSSDDIGDGWGGCIAVQPAVAAAAAPVPSPAGAGHVCEALDDGWGSFDDEAASPAAVAATAAAPALPAQRSSGGAVAAPLHGFLAVAAAPSRPVQAPQARRAAAMPLLQNQARRAAQKPLQQKEESDSGADGWDGSDSGSWAEEESDTAGHWDTRQPGAPQQRGQGSDGKAAVAQRAAAPDLQASEDDMPGFELF